MHSQTHMQANRQSTRLTTSAAEPIRGLYTIYNVIFSVNPAKEECKTI